LGIVKLYSSQLYNWHLSSYHCLQFTHYWLRFLWFWCWKHTHSKWSCCA